MASDQGPAPFQPVYRSPSKISCSHCSLVNSLYIHKFICVYIYMYIYIYTHSVYIYIYHILCIYICMHMHISGNKVQSLPTSMARHMYNTYLYNHWSYVHKHDTIYIYTYSGTHLKKPWIANVGCRHQLPPLSAACWRRARQHWMLG